MRDFWDSREPRERVLIGVMVALLLAFAAWFLLSREGGSGTSPKAALAEAQADRELWLRAAPRLNASETPAAARTAFSRAVLIDNARRRGIALSRVQPQSNDNLAVWIDGVDTATLYGLINDLTQRYNVAVESALMSTAANGSLNAQFTLASD